MLAEREKTDREMFAYHPEEDLERSTQFGGRLHFYAAGFSDDAAGMSDGFEFQRARLYLHTNFAHFFLNTFFWASVLDEDANQLADAQKDSPWGNFGFGKLELDFAGPKIVPKDIYLKWVGDERAPAVQVGYFKESLGLGVLTSSNDTGFRSGRPSSGA